MVFAFPTPSSAPPLIQLTATTFGDPSNIFSLSQGLVAEAESYIAAIEASASQLVAPVINPSFPVVTAPPTPATVGPPSLQTVTWNVPAEPAAFTGSANVAGLIIGQFTGTPPTLNFGTAPAQFTGAAPTSPSVNTNFTYPTVALTLPSVPSLLSLDTVTFPNIVIPGFNVTVPAMTAVAPGAFNYIEGALFTSALLTTLQTDLQNAIATGTGLSLPNAAQQALIDAAYEREYRTVANALAELERMETLGYAFPPGVYIDARLKQQTELNNTMAGISREIMATQYKTQLDNLVAARQNATALESKLIDYVNQVAQRTFEAAKYATEAAIAIYNANVEAYKAALQAFETQAQVYDTQIKGLLAQVEVTKAQIAFEQTKADINTSIVQQYKAEVEAAEAVLEIYKTQVLIIQTEAQVEKLKVDIYGAQIQAYVGSINAYTAEVEGYKAQAQTQGIIEDAYKTSVEAYTAEVNASVAQITAQVDIFKAQIAAYTAQLQGYDSAIKGMVGQAQAASEYNTAQAEVFKAEVSAITSYNGTLTAQWQAVLNEQEQITQIAVSAAKANGDLYIAARGLSLDASKVGAQVIAQLGAAALGAISWHTSSQTSLSESQSQNWSSALSQSQSNSFSLSTSDSTSTSNSTSTSTVNNNTNSTIDEEILSN